ncbi:MAG: glycogen synthase [Corynebacterium variabile]|uniref:glycogen synthase n=1 Tax=Corynebacterium variabile TaxID=1727 RepID=UPI002648072B|nr:glycogen synthase [Corynebacterium variabile]MDN6535894.1 glycogen synthase [Corynebacterium variabile]
MSPCPRTRRVLSVASECAPLIKTGGLADVVGALPAALEPLGWHTRVLLPGYPGVLAQLAEAGTTLRRVWATEDLFGGPATVRRGVYRTTGGTGGTELDLMVLDAPHLFDRLKLPTWDFHPESLEYHGLVSTLKAGMVHASRVTTVSPSYATELATPEFGFGLEGVAAMRLDRGEMTGILNGIDTAAWDPSTDPAVTPFSASDLAGKDANRGALLAEFGLDPAGDRPGPLAVVVTRLTHQKGVDLLCDALPGFLDAGGTVAVLGSGDPGYEFALGELAARYPGAMGVWIGYDEALSHRMYAGGDLVLVPSRFEPCGLTQLYGQRYGALPLVAATGGLRDTVTDATPENLDAGTATGFSFSDVRLGGTIDAGGLGFALGRAADLYRDTDAWDRLRRTAMTTPVDWGTSASRYADLFGELVG